MTRRSLVAAMAGAVAGGSRSASAATQGVHGGEGETGLKRIQAGVLDVAYVEAGPPYGPVVVLLHGFPYDIRAFDEVTRHLVGAGRRVIVPFLRGYGPTRFIDPATPRVGQQGALGSDLVAFLHALGIQRATLAGFDWGARAACVASTLHPECVSGLISNGGNGYNIQNLTEFFRPRAPG